MSLPHALLGLLAVEPRSGYALTKEFTDGLGRYAWNAGHTSIYPELGRLTEQGLIEVTEEGARGSRTYSITSAGREQLRSWLMDDPVGKAKVRNEPVLRMFLLSALEPADAVTVLRAVVDHVDAEIAELRRTRARCGAEIPLGREGFGQLAAEYGLRADHTVREWALWAIDQLARREQSSEDS